MKVGFIGLGNQGLPIAQRILTQGHDLVVWARRPESLDPFAGTAAVVAASPAELGAGCEVVGVCVLDDAGVRDIVFTQGLLDAMAPDSVLAIHSTVSPQTVIEVASAGEARGVHVLDAPVSGGAVGAAAGTMAVMVGGSPIALDRAMPVFSTFGSSVLRLGDVGAGQLCKLINNALFTAVLGYSLDALDLGVRFGLDREALRAMLTGGSANSFALNVAKSIENPAGAAHAGGLLRKDVDLLLHQLDLSGIASSALGVAAEEAVRQILRNAE